MHIPFKTKVILQNVFLETFLILLISTFSIYTEIEPIESYPCGKKVFYPAIGLAGCALAGYWTTTFLTLGINEPSDNISYEIAQLTSFPIIGSYAFFSGVGKIVTLYQNIKIKKLGKKRYKKKSVLQTVLYSTFLLTGSATVAVAFVDYFNGAPYNGTKSMTLTSSVIMTSLFVFDMHLFSKNCTLLKKNCQNSDLTSIELRPYVGISNCDKKLRIGVYCRL